MVKRSHILPVLMLIAGTLAGTILIPNPEKQLWPHISTGSQYLPDRPGQTSIRSPGTRVGRGA
jgi:hypothetical protein